MRKLTTLTGILSWINLVIGGLIILLGLFVLSASGQLLPGSLGLLLLGAIVLHSYAALRLRKSILHPEIPLDQHTPTGIRFIGFLVLMFAVVNIAGAIVMINNAGELSESLALPVKDAKPENNVNAVRGGGFVALLFCLSVAFNVLINLSLLKWYRFQQEERRD